jgi:putative SOS response-associated peptidase YedK
MCGRYRLTRADRLVESFEAVYAGEPEDLRPRYNIAPTQPVPVIRATASGRVVSSMRWGLIPSWAKDGSIAQINARSETILDKPAFKESTERRRCLIPADGFYEWVRYEVACVTVRRDHSFGPVVPSAVLYEVGRFGNEWSKSPRTM